VPPHVAMLLDALATHLDQVRQELTQARPQPVSNGITAPDTPPVAAETPTSNRITVPEKQPPRAAAETPTSNRITVPEKQAPRAAKNEAPGLVRETPPIISAGAYDRTRYVLGKLCPQGHDFEGTGQSLLQQSNRKCLACHREQGRARRAAKRQALATQGG
jgi:hypothetical protein